MTHSRQASRVGIMPWPTWGHTFSNVFALFQWGLMRGSRMTLFIHGYLPLSHFRSISTQVAGKSKRTPPT